MPPLQSIENEVITDGKTREFMALLDDLFDSMIDVPRVKHSSKQSIGSLINEETTILGNYIKKEEKMWIPRIFIL